MTSNLELLFVKGNYAEGSIPYGPGAWVKVKQSQTIAVPLSVEGVLTAHSASIEEFEAQVDRLSRELYELKREARRRFEADKARFLERPRA